MASGLMFKLTFSAEPSILDKQALASRIAVGMLPNLGQNLLELLEVIAFHSHSVYAVSCVKSLSSFTVVCYKSPCYSSKSADGQRVGWVVWCRCTVGQRAFCLLTLNCIYSLSP